MAEELRFDDYIVPFPVYLLFSNGFYVTIATMLGGPAVVIYTDDHLAERGMEVVKSQIESEFAIVEKKTVRELLEVLEEEESRGAEFAAIDPEQRPDRIKIQKCYTIKECFAAVERESS